MYVTTSIIPYLVISTTLHRLRPVIDRTLSFAKAKEAYRHFKARDHIGLTYTHILKDRYVILTHPEIGSCERPVLCEPVIADRYMLRCPARQAKMEERFGKGELRCPRWLRQSKRWRGTLPDSVAVHLVDVRECGPRSGTESPLHWRLLTTHTVETPEDALDVVQWYRQRWNIESDQAWCLSRDSGRRQSPPRRRCRADGAQGGNRLGIGMHELGKTGAHRYLTAA
jgi:hypothetical protein